MLVDCQQRDGLSHERQSMAVGAETARSELEELKIEVDRAKTQMTGLNRWEEACSAALSAGRRSELTGAAPPLPLCSAQRSRREEAARIEQERMVAREAIEAERQAAKNSLEATRKARESNTPSPSPQELAPSQTLARLTLAPVSTGSAGINRAREGVSETDERHAIGARAEGRGRVWEADSQGEAPRCAREASGGQGAGHSSLRCTSVLSSSSL